jgi:hypothetical protein
MAGAGTSYFNQKISQYNAIAEAGQSAAVKVSAAKQALEILAQAQVSQADAEKLVTLAIQAQ